MTRAAASSIASGRPSSRRQISATAGGVLVGEREVRRGSWRARSTKSAHRRVLRQRLGDGRRSRSGQRRAAAPAYSLLAAQVQRRAAGHQHLQPGHWRPAARPRPGAAGSTCSKLSSTSSRPVAQVLLECVQRRALAEVSARRAPGRSSLATSAGSEIGARSTKKTPSRSRPTSSAATWRPGGSCRCRPARSASPAGVSRAAARRRSATSRSRPSKRGRLDRQVVRRGRRGGRGAGSRTGRSARPAGRRARAGQIFEAVGAEIAAARSPAGAVADQRRRWPRRAGSGRRGRCL